MIHPSSFFIIIYDKCFVTPYIMALCSAADIENLNAILYKYMHFVVGEPKFDPNNRAVLRSTLIIHIFGCYCH
jgi:hypothetical protein